MTVQTDIETTRTATIQGTEELSRIVDLLRAQATLYRRLEQMAERQGNLVRSSDTQPLLKHLEERHKTIETLKAVSERLAPYRDRWDSVRNRMTPEQQRLTDSLIEEAGQRRSTVLRMNEHDVRMVSARKHAAGERLGNTGTAGRLLNAYGSPKYTAGMSVKRSYEG